MAFEIGNTLGTKTRIVTDCLRRVIAQDNGIRLRAALEKTLDKAAAGDIVALNWITDRIDGKPVQAIRDDSEHKPTVVDELEQLRLVALAVRAGMLRLQQTDSVTVDVRPIDSGQGAAVDGGQD